MVFFLNRLVTLSSAPFTIVHANGAFLRLSEAATGNILGAPLSSILKSELNTELPDCMVASSTGDHKKFVFKMKSSSGKPIESFMKVSPVVPQRSANKGVTTVTHYAIELIEQYTSSISHSLDSAPEIPVGVMG